MTLFVYLPVKRKVTIELLDMCNLVGSNKGEGACGKEKLSLQTPSKVPTKQSMH